MTSSRFVFDNALFLDFDCTFDFSKACFAFAKRPKTFLKQFLKAFLRLNITTVLLHCRNEIIISKIFLFYTNLRINAYI
jgi:hypothetical protein